MTDQTEAKCAAGGLDVELTRYGPSDGETGSQVALALLKAICRQDGPWPTAGVSYDVVSKAVPGVGGEACMGWTDPKPATTSPTPCSPEQYLCGPSVGLSVQRGADVLNIGDHVPFDPQAHDDQSQVVQAATKQAANDIFQKLGS